MATNRADQKDLGQLLKRYLRFWYLFVAGAAVAVTMAYIYLHYATPMYMAGGSLLFNNDKGNQGFSETAALGDLALMNSSRGLENEMLLLKSYPIMQRVVEELDLNVSYEIEGQVRDVEIYGEFVPIKIIFSKLDSTASMAFKVNFGADNTFEIQYNNKVETYKFGQEIEMPKATFTIVSAPGYTTMDNQQPLLVKFRNVNSVAHSYANRLSVAPVQQKATVLKISIVDAVPQKAIDIIYKLIEVYDQESIDDKNRIARRTVDFLDERLKYLTEELTRVEMTVQQYKSENEVTDVTSQAQQYLESLSANREQIEQIEIQIGVLESIEQYLNSGDKYQLVPSTLTLQDATLNGLITKFNELQLERERMLRNNNLASNPIVISINNQLETLRENILENLDNIKRALGITKRSLTAKSGKFGSRIQQVPVMERELIEITRQQEIKRGLYLYLLQKREESALSLAATVSNTRIVNPPEAWGQVSPNKIVVAYAFLLGLFIPFAGLYLRDLLNKRIRTRRDVERLTQTPILGDICHHVEDDAIVALENSNSPIAEMFRLMRTNLRLSAGGKENKVLLITSSMSQEGKTFFSINMGSSLAGAGKKVLVLEFDLRRPKLIKHLKLEKTKGITEFLIGDIDDPADIIRPSMVHPNLDVIGAGTLPPNPAELIMNPNVQKLIAYAKAHYDFVILDTPPIGKVADAYTLNDFTDTSIYVVRYNYTEKEQIEIIDDIFVNQKLHHPLIVLNDAKKSNSDSYTYGY